MIKYVLDTNTIISAHLSPLSVSRNAYNKALKQGIILHSKESLSELVQVFSRTKFDKYITIENRMKAIAAFEKKSYLTDVHVKVNVCRDSKDNKFLELAISGDASLIITGDTDLLVLNPFNNICIVNSADFINNF